MYWKPLAILKDIDFKEMNPSLISEVLVAQSELKEYFTSDEIQAFSDYLSSQEVEADSPVMAEGEPADCLMYMLTGKARVLSEGIQIGEIEVGAFFGESMFSHEATRSATVQTFDSSVVAVFTLEDYAEFIHRSPSLALKFRNYFNTIGSKRREQKQGLLFKDDKKYLALIAHNEMKSSLAEFVKQHSDVIGRFPLVATGTTGMMLYKETGLVLGRKVASGPLGGDQAIGTLVSTDNVCGIIFFRDPLSAHPHHADIEALGRLCDVYQIPFATNPGTAEAILNYLIKEGAHSNMRNQVLEKYRNQQQKVLKERT
jgi:methylglyoxal synthase